MSLRPAGGAKPAYRTLIYLNCLGASRLAFREMGWMMTQRITRCLSSMKEGFWRRNRRLRTMKLFAPTPIQTSSKISKTILIFCRLTGLSVQFLIRKYWIIRQARILLLPIREALHKSITRFNLEPFLPNLQATPSVTSLVWWLNCSTGTTKALCSPTIVTVTSPLPGTAPLIWRRRSKGNRTRCPAWPATSSVTQENGPVLGFLPASSIRHPSTFRRLKTANTTRTTNTCGWLVHGSRRTGTSLLQESRFWTDCSRRQISYGTSSCSSIPTCNNSSTSASPPSPPSSSPSNSPTAP